MKTRVASESPGSDGELRERVEAIYRAESRMVFATLMRKTRDFDLAEEALHEAFRAALEQWPRDGIPANPKAWLISVGRFKAIDHIRRRARLNHLDEASMADTAPDEAEMAGKGAAVEDDLLRLIFTCCHPALSGDAQVALTLREVCGLTTEAIAHAFLVPLPTLAQRIVRAKAKLREARIPYEVPGPSELPGRLEAALRVIYLVFNEGYAASSGDDLIRPDMSEEAIRLGRLLVGMLPDPEVIGLLALMLLQESRRTARTSPTGDLILLEEQDRSSWNIKQIEEGRALAARAMSSPGAGAYALQAAIAAVHAEAVDGGATQWERIVRYYDLLLELEHSPVVALNRAVAVAMRDGPAAGLELIDTIMAEGTLEKYHLAHAARADLFRRLGKTVQAKDAYRQALSLARQEPERRFLQRRLRELQD